MNPGDPRTLDPYRYADNNPVVYMDASGLNPSCGTYSAATQVCWSSYASVNATDPATTAAHKTVVQNSKGKISRPSPSECLAGAHCREIDIWNDTMPFTPIPLDKAYRYNVLLRAKMAPDIHVPSTIEILGATASLTAYEFFAGDAERCAGGSASDCGFAALGVIPGLGKAAKLGKVGSLSDDVVLARGGLNTPDRFTHGSGVVADDAGNLFGVSVNSGVSVADAASGIKHSRVGFTTVGDIRKAGGDVLRSPTAQNPGHCLVNGCSADALSYLFSPTVANPSRLGGAS